MQLRAAGIREKVSHNELLPELNLVLQGSLGGLDDDRFLGGVSRQYSEGGPGYGVGVVFSFPLENNAARARYERRQLETRQQLAQVKTTIDTVLLEVKVSAREVATAYRETHAKYEAVRAFTEDVETIRARRDLQALQDQAGIAIYLDHLIDAQDRRAIAEEDFIRAAANYQIAIVNLERAKGRLLAYEDVTIVRTKDEKKLPVLLLEKGRSEGKSTR
jgi:outer membrane protein TolC